MSFEVQVISALASSIAASGVLEKIYDVIRKHLSENAFEEAELISAPDAQSKINIMLKKRKHS
jgi:hypothetical protein